MMNYIPVSRDEIKKIVDEKESAIGERNYFKILSEKQAQEIDDLKGETEILREQYRIEIEAHNETRRKYTEVLKALIDLEEMTRRKEGAYDL